GVADLVTAESVHQIVRGNTAAASASLDTIGLGQRPPDVDVARLPRAGTMSTHRVAVVLADPSTPPTRLRAKVEPALDEYARRWLGDLGRFESRVQLDEEDGTG